jgi:hypothetical protein
MGNLVAIRNAAFIDSKGFAAISNSWHLRLEMTVRGHETTSVTDDISAPDSF